MPDRGSWRAVPGERLGKRHGRSAGLELTGRGHGRHNPR